MHENKIKLYKFQADQLRRCRENGNLVGCRKVGQCAEELFVIHKMKDEEEAIKNAGGRITMELFK